MCRVQVQGEHIEAIILYIIMKNGADSGYNSTVVLFQLFKGDKALFLQHSEAVNRQKAGEATKCYFTLEITFNTISDGQINEQIDTEGAHVGNSL